MLDESFPSTSKITVIRQTNDNPPSSSNDSGVDRNPEKLSVGVGTNQDEYKAKRDKNNEAVRDCRQKAKEKLRKQVEEKDELTKETTTMKARVERLRKEIVFLRSMYAKHLKTHHELALLDKQEVSPNDPLGMEAWHRPDTEEKKVEQPSLEITTHLPVTIPVVNLNSIDNNLFRKPNGTAGAQVIVPKNVVPLPNNQKVVYVLIGTPVQLQSQIQAIGQLQTLGQQLVTPIKPQTKNQAC